MKQKTLTEFNFKTEHEICPSSSKYGTIEEEEEEKREQNSEETWKYGTYTTHSTSEYIHITHYTLALLHIFRVSNEILWHAPALPFEHIYSHMNDSFCFIFLFSIVYS